MRQINLVWKDGFTNIASKVWVNWKLVLVLLDRHFTNRWRSQSIYWSLQLFLIFLLSGVATMVDILRRDTAS